MLAGDGGIDALTESLDDYFEGFLSEEKNLELSTERMTSAFERFGMILPESNAAFVDLVNSIDTSTAAGQELFGYTIGLSEACSRFVYY